MFDDRPTLRAVNITRGFGEGAIRTHALKGVSLELYPGKLAVLMGPSGSGKSTLLAILSGLLEPDSGQVLVLEGNDYRDLWQMSRAEREDYRLRKCGFIFQGYNLFPALTAQQQLEIVLRWGYNESGSVAAKKSREVLSLLGLGNKTHLKPAQLSGGEKQRVAIGRALVKDPLFCFADEPTSALDWSHGEQVIELLRSAAHDRGATILIVSHDHRILNYVDAAFHLEDGQLMETNAPAEGSLPMTAAGRYVR